MKFMKLKGLNIIISTLCIILNIACDDKMTEIATMTKCDTLKPLPYFPVYPGSFWKYIDTDGDTIIRKTNPTYEKDFYFIPVAAFASDTLLVPIYEGIPIWGYQEHVGPISHSGSNPLRIILTDTGAIGESWFISYWSGTGSCRKLIFKDSSITVLGKKYEPTLCIEQSICIGPQSPFATSRSFYARDIGLIREDILVPMKDSVESSLLLIEYFINK